MKLSTERILTTQAGSLPRSKPLLDLMKARLSGESYDRASYDRTVKDAVADTVKMQVGSGIDVVADGEMGKAGFFTYVRDRLGGFEPRPAAKYDRFAAETAAFPEYYADYFGRAMLGGAVAPIVPLCCVGPITYTGQAAIETDISNLKAALEGLDVADAFLPATAPSGVGYNEHYETDEAFFHAAGEALAHEYRAIAAAGLLLQIDDPALSEIFADETMDAQAKARRAEIYVEAINESLKGIPADRIRFHTCYGINEGPRIHEAALKDVAGYMLKVNAGAYSFEGANGRHEHEYHLWETLELPDGKAIIPGVITHASNIVEHPELIAERLVRYAKLVGRERVIAGADCGFSSQACYKTEVHPTVIRAKFEALAEGARLASRRLWSKPNS
ncbi:MAG TPA: cobalamin-independent methionine synthase II family protein [Gammaproteobacteria bacterium]|nr:cobalamin-independent methionine synthase II family protein [Gammaproteobacteria bacterium]